MTLIDTCIYQDFFHICFGDMQIIMIITNIHAHLRFKIMTLTIFVLTIYGVSEAVNVPDSWSLPM